MMTTCLRLVLMAVLSAIAAGCSGNDSEAADSTTPVTRPSGSDEQAADDAAPVDNVTEVGTADAGADVSADASSNTGVASPTDANDDDPKNAGGTLKESQTVARLYPNLASGALLYAQPKKLPEGVLLKSDGMEIRLTDLEEAIAQQPPRTRAMLGKEMFYVLEQEAAGKLLAQIARKASGGRERNPDAARDEQLINALFEDLTSAITASDEEQREFYQENPHFFHGAPFESAQPQIAQYLTQQKKQRFMEDYITKLGRTVTIEIADEWTRQQARMARDNPLDKARQGDRPTVALFYAASPCCPDKTASVLAEVGREFGSRLNVVSLNPSTEPILAARYGVRGNPVLLFYDADGKEVFRQQGAMSREEITARLAEMGVK